jgi:hypothetical protein
MKMKNISILFCVCLVLCSCSSQNQNITIEKTVPLDSLSVFLGMPTTIKVYNNLLYVMDFFGEDGFVKVIDSNKDSLLFSFARKGQGPNEYISIINIDVYEENNKTIVSLFDPALKVVRYYDQDSLLLQKDKCVPFQVAKYNDLRLFDMCKLTTGYIATGFFEKEKFVMLTDSLQVKQYSGSYRNKPNEAIPDMIHATAHYGAMFVSKDRKTLGSTIYMAGVLEVYAMDDNLPVKKWEYVINDFDYVVNDNNIDNKQVIGYMSGDFLQENIYAIYSGQEDDGLTPGAKELHVFDEKGTLVKKYDLQRNVIGISINPTNRKLYAITYEPEPHILVYVI